MALSGRLAIFGLFKDWLYEFARSIIEQTWDSSVNTIDLIRQYNWVPLPIVGAVLLIATWIRTTLQTRGAQVEVYDQANFARKTPC